MFKFTRRAGTFVLGVAVLAMGPTIGDADAANKKRVVGDQACSCLCGGEEVLGSDGIACSTFDGSACSGGDTPLKFESCKKCTVEEDGKCVINTADPLRPMPPKKRKQTERAPGDIAPSSPGTPNKRPKPTDGSTAPRSDKSTTN